MAVIIVASNLVGFCGASSRRGSAFLNYPKRRKGTKWETTPEWLIDAMRWPPPMSRQQWGVDAGVRATRRSELEQNALLARNGRKNFRGKARSKALDTNCNDQGYLEKKENGDSARIRD